MLQFQIDFHSTDLGSLLGNTQCGNCMTFLTCNVKINFGHFEAPKPAISTIWGAMNFEFLGTFDVVKCEIFLKNKIQSLQYCFKRHFLTFWNPPKLISHINHCVRKMAKFLPCEIPTVKIPNLAAQVCTYYVQIFMLPSLNANF